jgi:hypothetical protein
MRRQSSTQKKAIRELAPLLVQGVVEVAEEEFRAALLGGTLF